MHALEVDVMLLFKGRRVLHLLYKRVAQHHCTLTRTLLEQFVLVERSANGVTLTPLVQKCILTPPPLHLEA